MISFQIFGKEYLMSYMDFSIRMGMVNVEYVRTKSYSQLHIDLAVHLSLNKV